MRSKD